MSKHVRLIQCAVLILLGLAIYHQTFGFGFVFDDKTFIINNVYIQNLHKIDQLWSFLPKTRFIVMYSFALNYFIGHLDPQGYHIFNFIIHLLATLLVWGTATLIFKTVGWIPSTDKIQQKLPFIISVLFLVHPCQTQAVTYISQRFESLATVLYLATIYCYLRARTTSSRMPQISFFTLSCVCALLGLLTKEVAITIPLMLLAIELILHPKPQERSSEPLPISGDTDRIKIFIVLLTAGTLLGTLFLKLLHFDLSSLFLIRIPSESHYGDILNVGNYSLTQMRVFLTFCRLLIFPVNQNLDYDFPASTDLMHPPLTLVGMGLIAIFILLIFKLRKKLPLVAFGLAWMLITFSINLAPRLNVIWEHKLYLISFGFFLSTTALLSIAIQSRRLLFYLLVSIISIWAFATYQRNQIWHDGFTLWTDVIKKSPGKARPYAALGQLYLESKHYDEAIRYLDLAVTMDPSDQKNYLNLGIIYTNISNQPRALKAFSKAIEINFDNYDPYILRSEVYKKMGDYPAALLDLDEAIRLKPGIPVAYTVRGALFLQQRRMEDALKDYQRALDIDPDNSSALNGRAVVYYSQGQYALAMNDLNRAQRINPMDPAVYQNKASCLMKTGQKDEALENLRILSNLGRNQSVK